MEVTLYGIGSNRSARCRWTLDEAGIEYTSIDKRELASPDELRQFHPLAKVPAAVIDGQTLYESAAICTYLADLVPEKGLIAASGTRERALHMQWVSFVLTEMEAFLWSNARNTFVLPEEQRITALFEQNVAAYLQAAKVLERHLTDHPYMIADQFSVTDILVGFVVNWGSGVGLLKDLPQLNAYLERLKARPHSTL